VAGCNESHIAAIRDALGEDAYRREWAAGQSMSWEQLTDYALGGAPAQRGNS